MSLVWTSVLVESASIFVGNVTASHGTFSGSVTAINFYGTASQAISASWAPASAASDSASYATFAISASHAVMSDTASYAYSASVEIVTEVSSSHAVQADSASYYGGSVSSSYIHITNIDTSGNLIPTSDALYNLGSSTNYWDNIYARKAIVLGSSLDVIVGRENNLESATSKQAAIAIGGTVGTNVVNASYGTFIGYLAGDSAGICDFAMYLGYTTGRNAKTSSYATMIGTGAGRDADIVTNAVFIGPSAGRDAVDGRSSVMIGDAAGLFTANQYIAVGIGYHALYACNTDADYAVGIGYNAGAGAWNARFATIMGYECGRYARDARYLTAIGYQAGQNASDALQATMIGGNAGRNADTASQSTFIGWNADAVSSGTSTEKSTAIGYNAKVTSDYQFILGGSGSDAVNVGINTNNPQYRLHVIGEANITGVTSSFLGNLEGTASFANIIKRNIRTVSASFVVTGNDYAIICSSSAGDYYGTLPNANSVSNNVFHIKNIGNNTVYLQASDTSSIEFGTTQSLSPATPSLGNNMTLISDGIQYWIL